MVNFSVPNLFFLQILYIFFEDLLLLGKRKWLYFSFTCVVSTTIYHTALKNHHMYILLQQLLNLIFIILQHYYVDMFHVSTKCVLISTTTLLRRSFMNKYSQKQHNKKQQNPCSFMFFCL